MDDTVSGVFVDFGDRFFASLDKVQPLTPEFCTMPCLALNAKLHGKYQVEIINSFQYLISVEYRVVAYSFPFLYLKQPD